MIRNMFDKKIMFLIFLFLRKSYIGLQSLLAAYNFSKQIKAPKEYSLKI